MDENHSILLSGFADEAAIEKTLDQQFAAIAALGMRFLSLRFVDLGNGVKNVMRLEPAEVMQVKERLAEYGLTISSIGSPIGKVKLLDVDDGTENTFQPFEEYLESEVRRACEFANAFDTKLVRGFSFYHPRGTDPEVYMAQAVDQLGRIADVCDRYGLTFGLEVEANLVGQNGQILARMHQLINRESLVLVFDGANLVTQGFLTAEVFAHYELMKPGLGWIHIKDFRNPGVARRVDYIDEEQLKHYVPANIGDSGYLRILQDLRDYLPVLHDRMVARGVAGVFADLEPHLKGGGQFGGFSGPDGFGIALRAFCQLCDAAQIGYQLRNFDDIRAERGL